MPERRNTAIDQDRLWRDLMDLATITDPDRPYTRRSFSARFAEGRRWLEDRFADVGMTARLDTAGNLIARREGSVPGLPPIVIGSHSDTVPSGGRFDGTLGILAGIEAVRVLQCKAIVTRHPVEVVDFLAEEPSEFGLSCVGSRGMSGSIAPEHLALRDPSGKTLREAIGRIGGRSDDLDAAQRSDIAAFLELHIEQGCRLESTGTHLGIVTGIVGIVRLEIVFTGAADHAGATPFDLRRDALVAAARTITAVRTIGEELAARGSGYVIATAGCIEVQPNAANVVPRLARLVIEGRAEDPALLAAFVEALDAASDEAAGASRVERTAFSRLSSSQPSLCDPRLHRHLSEAARELGLSSLSLASGAGHDAAFMARIAPMAMVFVPSRAGKSHCAEEWTEREQCANGAAVLLEALLRIDRDTDFDTATGPAPVAQPAERNSTR